jgi:hypothetical protein
MKIAMTAPEIALLDRMMTPLTRYLEFGAGGSTIFALERCATVTSVDSHPDWLKAVRDAAGAGSSRLTTIQADIGEVKEWGYPVDESEPGIFSRYFHAADYSLNDADLILVDGRFRVACFAHVVAMGFKGPIMFHDYRDRPWFHDVEQIAKPVISADTLSVFLPTHREAAADLLKKYSADPR